MDLDIVELVPNVSEGRSALKVDELSRAFADGGDVWLLDVHRDESHHRSVLTAVARPASVPGAAVRLLECALRLIDLRTHRGEHPRNGALDVFPLVALGGVSRDAAIALAERVAEEISGTFDLPVFLYGDAARVPSHRNLPRLRRGGFEALEHRMATADLVPDFGPRRPHPTAGACAVGVRGFLIAYNVELATTDRGIAEAVARKIRTSSGGLPQLQALGFERLAKTSTQVSMNLTDFRVTSIERAFDAVSAEARKLGVDVLRSEIVGLVPQAAVFPGMVERLKLDRDPPVLEQRTRDHLIP